MDSVWTFINQMSVWNWLTLIAFVLLPIGTINSVLGLRARYRDWKAMRGQEAFGKRLEQLRASYQLAERSDAQTLIYQLGTDIAFLICITAIYVLLFLLLIYIRLVFNGSFVFETALFGGAIGGIISVPITYARIERRASEKNFPHTVVDSTLKVLKKGLKKGFSADVATVLKPVLESSRWNVSYKEQIQKELDSMKRLYGEQGLRGQHDLPIDKKNLLS